MRFSDDFLSELHARIDIEELIGRYVDIRHRGSRTPVALCPFHNEKTPSFVIYRDTQSYYCFGCGAGGEAINFIKNIERLDYTDAVRFLADMAGMAMPLDPVDDEYNRLRRRCYEANREAAKFFHSALFSDGAAKCREYIGGRKLTKETVTHFGLGFAPDSWDALISYLKKKGYTENELLSFDLAKRTQKGHVIDAFRNRMIFPIIDLRGNVVAFGGRVLDDSKPKYLNTADTPVFKKSNYLYALNFAKNNSDRKLILCEGYMDVIAMHQAGFTNAVAGLGTAFTDEHVSLLSRYCDEVTLCFDSDEAGIKATQKALRLLERSTLKVKVMSLDGGKDPDEIIKTRGKEKMSGIINSALNDTEFALSRAKAKYDTSTEDGKLGYITDAVGILAEIKNPVESDLYISKLAGDTGVSKDAIASQVERKRKTVRRREDSREFEAALENVRGGQLRSPNPEKKQNLKAVNAEEIILASLLKHPDYLRKLGGVISADVFVTEYNRRFFENIAKRIIDGRSIDLSAFAEDTDNGDMSYLAYLTAKGKNLANSVKECRDCLETLSAEKARLSIKNVNSMSDEDYRRLFEEKRKKISPKD